MFELIAAAIRIETTIQVTIHGFLRTSSWGAVVMETYPGSVIHLTDPGQAEVYLGEYETPGSLVSLRSPMPWTTTVNLTDSEHNEVVIFVNNQEIRRIPVTAMPSEFE